MMTKQMKALPVPASCEEMPRRDDVHAVFTGMGGAGHDNVERSAASAWKTAPGFQF